MSPSIYYCACLQHHLTGTLLHLRIQCLLIIMIHEYFTELAGFVNIILTLFV
jgi:hypothetical protein